MSNEKTLIAPELDFDTPAARRLRKVRAFKDKFASGGIAFGGISVIIAIVLIFFYLLYEVAPLFQSASMQPWQKDDQAVEEYAVPGSGKTLYMAVEEQAEIAFRVNDKGQMTFFRTTTGEVVLEQQAELPEGTQITTLAKGSNPSQMFALGLSDGTALVMQHAYKSVYPEGERIIVPSIKYPLGKAPVEVDAGKPLELLALSGSGENWALIGGQQNHLGMAEITLEENFLTGEIEASSSHRDLPGLSMQASMLKLMPNHRWLLAGSDNGQVAVIDLKNNASTTQVVKAANQRITSMRLLLGGSSLLVADDTGYISQWFNVRDENGNWQLTRVRTFETNGKPITNLAIEHRRKGFAAIDEDGSIFMFSTTAEREVLDRPLVRNSPEAIAFAPRSNALLVENNGQLSFWEVHNEHPEISWSALWDKVWYEGYEEPEYTWQSSASNNDFEPKYSLMPLAFGTLKAAFYAMLLATPLAICGAIYTAYFMAPALRRKVKPVIELMEALPTVILGFLAGLWLAPFMETNLAGVFVTLLVLPLAIVGFAFIWAQMPSKIRWLVPEGWDVLLLIPVVILATLFSIEISVPVENLLFGGDLRHYISNDLGIPFDQRNALVVGIAMGFAVIPTIFSITEDAIFAVPKHLTYGSLALGATQWQTLVRVVMPTASPGIFSAVMIGMGRAVGETMIVLMATGNTPIMDINIFEGMRTLAANIAVEMPESEVGSTHYRILFLAAFVLFLFTFVVNTLAELIRQRLRKKYGSL